MTEILNLEGSRNFQEILITSGIFSCHNPKQQKYIQMRIKTFDIRFVSFDRIV